MHTLEVTETEIEVTESQINEAEAFSKKIMELAFERKLPTMSLLIAAKALEHSAQRMIIEDKMTTVECDCEGCMKLKKFKQEMN